MEQPAAFLKLAPDDANVVSAIPSLLTGDAEALGELAELVKMARTNSTEFSNLMGDQLVGDTIQRDTDAIESNLNSITRNLGSRNAADRIAAMPFLETEDAVDAMAVSALRQLAWAGDLPAILGHPQLQDGITDEQAKIVATPYGVAKNNPDLVDVLLDPGRVTLEERIISTPLSGHVLLTIIRTQPGRQRSMDLLEHAVQTAESLIGIPFPTNFVAYLFADAATNGYAGLHFGPNIISKPEVDIGSSTFTERISATHIAHEVAHYYWRGEPDWVDEGAADFLSYYAEWQRSGRWMLPGRKPCGPFDNLNELESANLESGDEGFACNYSLGQRFFLGLYELMDSQDFRKGFAKLNTVQADPNISLEFNHVVAAFESDAESNVLVKDVISHWYYGTPLPESAAVASSPKPPAKQIFLQLAATPPDPTLPSIQGEIRNVYITRGDSREFSSIARSELGERLLLTFVYSQRSRDPYEIPLQVLLYYPDGELERAMDIALRIDSGGRSRVWVSSPESWRIGQYWIMAFDGDRKGAEVEFEITP